MRCCKYVEHTCAKDTRKSKTTQNASRKSHINNVDTNPIRVLSRFAGFKTREQRIDIIELISSLFETHFHRHSGQNRPMSRAKNEIIMLLSINTHTSTVRTQGISTQACSIHTRNRFSVCVCVAVFLHR